MTNRKPGPQGQPQQFNINLNDIDNMKCSCGSNIFISAVQLKFISAFFTPAGQDTGVAVPRYICANPACGLMYAGAMSQAEVKKYSRKPSAERFDWGAFFIQGGVLLDAIVKAQRESQKKAGDIKNAEKNSLGRD